MADARRERALDLLVGLSLMFAMGMAAHRYFGGGGDGETSPRAAGGIPIGDWKSYLGQGHRLAGHARSPVSVVVFSDFQCPACRTMSFVLAELEQRYGDSVQVVYRHFPLEGIHPFARDAALAAECAGANGRFRAFHDRLFASQDAIGTRTWADFASDAGVLDTAALTACTRDSTYVATVRADVADGMRLRVRGTPSALVNRWFVVGAGRDRLFDLVERELDTVR